MVVKKYDDAQAYLHDYENDLLENEPVSQLILHNAYQVGKGAISDCLFGVVLDELEIPVLHFCNSTPYNMAVYTQYDDKETVLEAAAFLAKHLIENDIAIIGLNAKYEVCHAFIEEYKKHVECSFIEKLAMDIMVIRELNDTNLIEGRSRFATMDEVKIITEWMVQYQIEARATVINYEDALNKARKFIEEKKVYVLDNNELEMVSMAIATRELAHGIGISNVFTPEQYRGVGYAATNIFYMCNDMFDKGYEFCTLFVDKKNLITNRAYEKLGFQVVDDNYDYQLVLS